MNNNNNNNIEEALYRIKIAKENKLRYLDLSGLLLDKVPEDISDMTYLMDLDLSFNKLSTYPDCLPKLDNLHYLNISNNDLREVNFSLGKYYSYKEVDFSNNLINSFPEDTLLLREEVKVIYHDNPFLNKIPHEIIYKEDLKFIQFYLDSFSGIEKDDKLFETKLLLVGKGDVGKTTMVKTLINPTEKISIGEELPTEGINIESENFTLYFPAQKPYYSRNYYDRLVVKEEDLIQDFNVSDDGEITEFEANEINYCPLYLSFFDEITITEIRYNHEPHKLHEDIYFEQNVKVNFWDFGGQEILYGTHQFFLTKRSVYIFVWDSRTDNEEESFDYWLNVISRLSDNSPVLVVMNKADLRIKNIDERYYRKKFPNIIDFFKVSCFTKEGINELLDHLNNVIYNLPHLCAPLPPLWGEIRKKIQSINQDFVNFSEFRKLCFDQSDDHLSYLSSYLNDIGDIVHFNDDIQLKDLVVINPHWLTKAIYALIHSLEIQKANGVFNSKELSHILNNKIYPPEKHNNILLLMQKFEICFKIHGSSNLFIIPTLLEAMPKNEQIIEEFITPNSLKYELDYEFMPSGIIERLICRLKSYIRGEDFWKFGVVLRDNFSEGLVISDKSNKKINVYVKGEYKSNLYSIITHELKQINSDLKLLEIDYNEKWACICISCQNSTTPNMISRKIINNFKSKGNQHIQCYNSAENVEIEQIILGYKPKTQRSSLLSSFINASINLLERKVLTRQLDENGINSFFQVNLKSQLDKKYLLNEQALRGLSESRKGQGELDILVEDEKGVAVTFFEGVILTSVDKKNITKHILKTIDQYDSVGLKEKFFGVYYRGKDFKSFSDRYYNYITEKHPCTEDIEIINIKDLSNSHFSGSEIKLLQLKYKRNNNLLYLYHIVINLGE